MNPQEQDRITRAMEKIEESLPPRMRMTSTDHPEFNRELWAKVTGWRPSPETPWLGLTGPTGTCKTRILYVIALEIARERISQPYGSFKFEAVDGLAFTRIVMDQFSDAPSEQVWGLSEFGDRRRISPGARLATLRKSPFLIFDEIGKVKPSPAIASELFSLIDYRAAHNLPLIWAGNRRPEEFCASMPDEYGAPIAGRMVETSIVVEA